MKVRRRKPLIFDAVIFDPRGEHRTSLPAGVNGIQSPNADNWGYAGCEFSIVTLEGVHRVNPGDVIVTGERGERWPVRRDIFDKTYEIVEPTK